MFKSYWITAVAFGLILSVSSAWPQTASEDQPRQEESASDTNSGGERQNYQPIDLSPALKNIEAAIRDLITDEDKIEAQHRQDTENRDLKAQEGMAWWAELMFYAAAASVILTLAALYAIIRTLHHTRRAADYTQGMLIEAKSTTNAAQETVAITRRVGFTQTRPYVGFADMIGKLSDDGRIVVWAQLRNFGNTPAINVKATLEAQIVEGEELGSFSFKKKKYATQSDIFPGNAGTIADIVALNDGDLHAAVISGKISIEIVGFVSYRDIEGGVHRTLCHGQIHASKSPMSNGDTYIVASAIRGNKST
jgi:hypothetical protein